MTMEALIDFWVFYKYAIILALCSGVAFGIGNEVYDIIRDGVVRLWRKCTGK